MTGINRLHIYDMVVLGLQPGEQVPQVTDPPDQNPAHRPIRVVSSIST